MRGTIREDKQFAKMDEREVIKIAKEYKKAVIGQLSSASVYLYGSYSKGEAHEYSDIDLAIVVPHLDGDYMSTSAKLWRLTMDINTLIEPILIEECHPSPLYEDILRTGVLI